VCRQESSTVHTAIGICMYVCMYVYIHRNWCVSLVFFIRSCTIAQTLSRRPLTAKHGFEPRSHHVGFVVDKVALGQGFFLMRRISPINVNPLMIHRHLNIVLTKRTKPGNFQTKRFSVGNRTAGHWMEKYYHIPTSVLQRVEDLRNNRL